MRTGAYECDEYPGSAVTSGWEASHFQRSGWGWVRGGGGEQEKVREEEKWLVCKMNKTFKRKKITVHC